MKNNLTFIVLTFLFFSFISCTSEGNKDAKEKESVSKDSFIDDEVLQVKLGDNRTQIGEKLTNQGYKWEDTSAGIVVKETFKYDDKYFDKAVFTIFDAKLFFTSITNTYYSEEESLKAFEEYDTYFNSKYSKFKTAKTNDLCQKYSEYDDKKINLSIMLIHSEKTEVPALFQDEETLQNAKEHWDVSITYNKSGTI